MSECILDDMNYEDWEQVRLIYLEGIATGHATFEEDAPTWAKWNAGHLSECRIVARSGDTVRGWAALSRVSNRKVYEGVAEISIYVGGNSRGEGLGRRLLTALVAAAEKHGLWTLQAGIFPENKASIDLHRSCGFREVGKRERIGKMNGVWRDTVLFERRSQISGIA